MRRIHLAAVTVNQTPLAWSKNKENILRGLEAAKQRGAQFICFPELCLSGYGCEDAFFSRNTVAQAERMLLELLPFTSNVMVAVGLPVFAGNNLYNAVAVIANEHILGFALKQHLAGDGIHYEPRWFKPWAAGEIGEVLVDEVSYPAGDIVFECDGVKYGFEICEDAWVSRRVGMSLADRGADIIFNPSASHFAFYKRDIRRRIVLEGSRAFGVSYVHVNLLGNEAGRAIYDGSAIIASTGQKIAEGRRFSFADFQVTDAVIDLDRDRLARYSRFDAVQSAAGTNGVVVSDFTPMREAQSPVTVLKSSESWENSPNLKEEEFSRAVTLGLFDYLRKSHSKGFVVSLSGGADSSAISCLVFLMVKFATAEHGLQQTLERLGRAELSKNVSDIPSAVRSLLLCVYQRTKNSGEVTQKAAEKVAQTIGAEFFNVDVEPIAQLYRQLAESTENRKLTWESDDVSLQNIQARTRGPFVWFLANLRSSLLLATSNRSEAAVGYATMDGDTCGGLSPIAGIDKDFLRRWLRWMEASGPDGLSSIPELAVINSQAPTAELRPGEAKQTDEADLMPYPILDIIERWAIRDKRSPKEVLALLVDRNKEVPEEQLRTWVKRFFVLWSRNQWKRERYAPSFHLDDENLDPKTWCRFPILSGGYEDELKDL